MLSERQLEEILQVFRHRAQAVTEEYLIRMGQHLRDIGTLSASDVNRLIELKRINYNMEQIKRQIARAANVQLSEVEDIFRQVAESDLRFASKVFGADHMPAIKDNPALERILKAQAKITKQALSNLSQTTILSDGYKNAVDVAVQTAQAGVADYNSAIRRAMKTAARDGLRVQYPNSGLTRRLDSAVRMNVLDGIRAINQDVMRQVGKKFGADGIELTAHNLCAEDHIPYQGLQMSNKEFDRLQNTILDRPFGMWNCRHSWHPILLGISQPAYSAEDLADFKRNSRERIEIDGVTKTRYEWTQEQRRIETAIRQQKDIAVAAKASGDMVARRECAYMIQELDKYYSKISDAAGLNEQRSRMRVAGFSAVKPADQLKKYQQAVFRTIDDPVREVLGSAYDSHPNEVARIKKNLEKMGVEFIEQDENFNGSIAYYPGAVLGTPGQFKINKNASYGAWIHEEQHAIDDKESGWQGSRIVWTNEAIEWERRAYQKEIDLMKKMGYNEIVQRLEKLLENEIKRRSV